MMSNDMQGVLDVVATEHGDTNDDPTLFVCENGLRLRLRRVSQILVMDAGKYLKRPKIPRTWDEDKHREIENPTHPDYLEEVRHFNTEAAQLAINIYLMMGATPIEPLPSELEPIDGTGWVDMLGVVYPELEVPPAGPKRKLIWLKYYAMPDDDTARVMARISRLGGAIMEADVRNAQDSFRPDETRNPDQGVGASVQATHGVGDGTPTNGIVGGSPGIGSAGDDGVHPLPANGLGQA